MTQSPSDPKPQQRHRATPLEWNKMRNGFRGYGCFVCGERWQSLHHLYPRSQGGDDVAVNLVPLCGSGTTGCHGRVEARDKEARAAVRANLLEGHKWYLTYKLGHGAPAWLDKAYPELEIAA